MEDSLKKFYFLHHWFSMSCFKPFWLGYKAETAGFSPRQ